MSPLETAQTFFAHWSANRIDEAVAMLSDDVLYDNVPLPDIVGRENVRSSRPISASAPSSRWIGRSPKSPSPAMSC